MIKCPFPSCSFSTEDIEEAGAQLTIHGYSHIPAAPVQVPAQEVRKAKVKAPSIGLNSSEEKHKFFEKRWTAYKNTTGVTGNELTGQLMDTCSEDLRLAMFQDDSEIESRDEAAIIESIKKLAVKKQNAMVSRIGLYSLQQEADEGIRNFVARIKGQAELCSYTVKCTADGCETNVRYTDQVVRDTLIRGMYDTDHQREVLGQENQDMGLEALLALVEAKELGRKTQASILSETGGAGKTSYKKRERNPPDKSAKCRFCGKTGHGANEFVKGESTVGNRESNCPAFKSTCEKCKKKGHFTAVCKSKPKKEKTPTADSEQNSGTKTEENEDEGAAENASIFTQMCAAEARLPNETLVPAGTVKTLVPAGAVKTRDGKSTLVPAGAAKINEVALVTKIVNSGRNKGKQHIVLEAHQFDGLKGWTEKQYRGQPTIPLQARVVPSDYAHFGYKFDNPAKSCRVAVITDTGCMSTLIGLNTVYSLGYKKADLIPTKQQMSSIDKNAIDIVGAIILRLSGTGAGGETYETTQICYVSPTVKGFYISEQGCKQLRIIPFDFPKVGAADIEVTSAAAKDSKKLCDCPSRKLPPPLPEKIPFPPKEENREKIEKWILEYYADSSFNTCEHQTLPLMEGPPVRIMVSDDMVPTVVHTPIAVPLYWQEKVKSDIDRDVALGVIEPVPIGEPVTHCARMVITRKKDGNPRRCVDYQQLNKYTTRETHHTMSPFHQATLFPPNTKKTVTDAWNGYHSVPIHKDDHHYTTFITPWGRYRYRNLPQGLISAGDGYTRRYDEIVVDIPDKTKCIDDVGMWAEDIEKSFFQTCRWMDRCGRHGITQNPKNSSSQKTRWNSQVSRSPNLTSDLVIHSSERYGTSQHQRTSAISDPCSASSTR